MAEPQKPPNQSAKPQQQPVSRPSVQKANAAGPQGQLSKQQALQKHLGESGIAQGPTPQQIQQLKEQQLKQARAKFGNSAFASTSQEILKKFAKYPPSLTFHIYDSHYRFNNTQDSSIIPKESPMAQSFLKHIIREEIPVEMTELLKDFAVRFYDGCLVLQVYDHRHMVPVAGANSGANSSQSSNSAQSSAPGHTSQGQNAGPKPASSSSGTSSSTSGASSAPDKSGHATPKDTSAPPSNLSRPKTYRTLLRPTPQSLYYDLLYHTDSTLTKFTDLLSLQMEAGNPHPHKSETRLVRSPQPLSPRRALTA
ncbi:hypothetical protein JCM33374_g4648 [Metschnikowia sp. JCM 33374]|nr:hypothetical protein JCM33374_g4648 [Metschnikowia sp. JCM 33374]